VTDLWALLLGFVADRTELVPGLHIFEVAYKGKAVFATPLEGVSRLEAHFRKAFASITLGKR
jgi:hypothetical protein